MSNCADGWGAKECVCVGVAKHQERETTVSVRSLISGGVFVAGARGKEAKSFRSQNFLEKRALRQAPMYYVEGAIGDRKGIRIQGEEEGEGIRACAITQICGDSFTQSQSSLYGGVWIHALKS